MKFDDLIINYLGEFGTYQKVQFFVVCLPTIITAMHAFTWTFTAADMRHRCRLPSEKPNASYWLRNVSLHLKLDESCTNEPNCKYAQCFFDGVKHCPHGLVFDVSDVQVSATNQWEIACDWQFLKAFIQSSYYIGQMVGSLLFGFLGDRIGRRKVFTIAILMQITAGLLMIIAPHWALYAVLRAIVGAAHPGVFMIAVVIGVELMGPSKRKIASVMSGVFFAIGEALLGLAAYYFRADYHHLQAVIALPSIIFIIYWWIVPESARWLISQQRFAEADAILQRIARVNKTTLPEKWWEEIETSNGGPVTASSSVVTATDEEKQLASSEKVDKAQRRHNFIDLLRTARIRRISLAVFFIWPVVSMIYYGMSMDPTFLGGNFYNNYIFGSLMEIPALFLVYFLLDKVGRKPVLFVGFLIVASCTLSDLFFNAKAVHWSISFSQYLISKCAITAVYVSLYTFTPELFPTVIRNMAMGVCSMMARFGAISASYIAMWLKPVYGNAVMIVPFTILGFAAAVLLMIFLPETAGAELPETIEEMEGTTRSYELQPLKADEEKKAPPTNKSS